MNRFGAIALGFLALGGTASAAPGDHLRAGDVEIIPDIDIGGEYRTNVYRSENTTIPAANLRIAPGVTAALEGDDFDFKAGGEWQLRKYFFVGDDALGPENTQSTGERITNLDRFNEFSLSAGIDTLKRSVVGFRLSDGMSLKNFRADAELADLPYSSQFRNTLQAGLRINPGPALEFVPGFSWSYDSFQVPRLAEDGERALNGRNTYGPRLDAKWAFLPRTALVFRSSFLVHQWRENALTTNDPNLGAEIALPNSQHLKLQTGIDGRFTEKLFLQFLLGYGVAFYNENTPGLNEVAEGVGNDVSGLRSLLMRAQIRYDVTQGTDDKPGTQLSAGFVRDFRDSFFTNYKGVNAVFLQYTGRLDEFQPLLKYEIRSEDYDGEIARNDLVNKFTGDIGYWFQDWASVSTGVWWQQRASNVDNVEYDDFNIHALATFVY